MSQVAIIMGSKSDFDIMNEAIKILESFDIETEYDIVSAHRTPNKMVEYASNAEKKGIKVIIAGAGIKYSLKYKIPLIGICRGMQFIYKYFGGNLVKLKNNSHVRKSGSAALDIAYVASGRYDGYWHREINYWDIAAGLILVKESGGFVESLNSNGFLEKKIDIIATNSKIHKELRNLL